MEVGSGQLIKQTCFILAWPGLDTGECKLHQQVGVEAEETIDTTVLSLSSHFTRELGSVNSPSQYYLDLVPCPTGLFSRYNIFMQNNFYLQC